MSTRSVSSKIAKMASSVASNPLDMILMGACVVVIVCLLVYIYNRFIHKQHHEYFGCDAGQTCCLQGWHGKPPNCKQCPAATPSSPRTKNGGPDEDCNCPNASVSSCFACPSPICSPFKVDTGICTPVCPNCSVQRRGNKLVPKCN
jgi:hypothetical protein